MKSVRFVVCMIIMVLMFGFVSNAQGENSADKMKPYIEKLKELNAEYGTEYDFLTSSDESYEDFVNRITSMSIEDFEKSFREAYLTDCQCSNFSEECFKVATCEITEDSTYDVYGTRDTPYLTTQRYIYEPISGGLDAQNYFYINIYTNYVNGHYIYTTNCLTSGSVINQYPGLKVLSYTSTLGPDNTYVEVSYTCCRALSDTFVNTVLIYQTLRYYAGTGDMWNY